MSTLADKPKQTMPERQVKKHSSSDGLHISMYDQVASVLIAGLLLFGSIVALLFVIWLGSRTWIPTPAIPVMMVEDVGGGGSGPGGGERVVEQQFEEPSAEEMPDVAEPRVEDSLDAISLAVTTPEVAELTLGELSSSSGNGEGTGQGDGRGPGPGGPGTSDGIPAWERWEVRLNATTTEEYAKQLDFFKIELAVAGGGSPVVTYVTNVATSSPTVRTGSPKDEKRLRFMHRTGALRDADRRLVGKAKVDAAGKIVFQFYSPETYKALLTLENIAMGQRRIIEVRRTIFGVKAKGAGYEFYVIGQDYR